MKRPVLAAQKAGAAEQNHVAGRGVEVPVIGTGPVVAKREVGLAFQDKNADQINFRKAVFVGRNAD